MQNIIGVYLDYGISETYNVLQDPLNLFNPNRNIPWNDVKSIKIEFDGNIPIPLSTSDFVLTDSASNPQQGVAISQVTVVNNLVIVEFSPKAKRGIFNLSSTYDGNLLEPFQLDFRVLVGDVNNSNTIDTYDLYLIRTKFGSGNLLYDINGDGVIDLQDYAVAGQNRLYRLP